MSRINAKRMRCGSCGHASHEIYQCGDGSLLAKCEECKNESHITVTTPKLVIKAGDEYDGMIAVF